jgi:hypothetical protein
MRSNLLVAQHSRVRLLLVPAVLLAAAAHLPVIRPHLSEAPYMGVLFVLLTAACVLLAATLISWDSPLIYLLSASTCGLAVLGYAATRLTAFPMLADDVGNWTEPLGLVAVAAESVAVITIALVKLTDPSKALSRPRTAGAHT